MCYRCLLLLCRCLQGMHSRASSKRMQQKVAATRPSPWSDNNLLIGLFGRAPAAGALNKVWNCRLCVLYTTLHSPERSVRRN
mmetsp:Transcript_12223/g.23016  ORF Transcript_12223/g.23016 Transcript_12223/m.23016 type:complete len:82 (+) Transcript_12223:82-327(+)